MLILDSHLDLAFNALQLNRDLTLPAATVRTHDSVAHHEAYGACTTTFPELRRGQVGIFFATVMSRLDPHDRWTRTGMYTQDQCYAVGRGHAAYYQVLERQGLLRFIRNTRDLDQMAAAWRNPQADTPFGMVLAMESADPILGPDNVQEWHDLVVSL